MNRKLIYVFVFSFFVSMLFVALCSNIKPVQASDGIQREKCVTSIRVKEGDTLWGIASRYYTAEYESINDLVKEIKESNHINDTIYIGQNIIVPHYRMIS
ncbi:MAG: hypothetical protein PWP24_309 [Clostridiales bacterium]|nr:hypothetical protein [Clostridiales bacterium]